jgi:hypothetical protein
VTALFWVAYGLQWLVLVILAALVMLMYRQFGLMIMPGGKRVSYGGLDVGSRAPAVVIRIGAQREDAYDWAQRSPSDDSEATLALFAMPTCPMCAKLAAEYENLAQLARHFPSVKFMWIQSVDAGSAAEHEIQLPPGWVQAMSSNGTAHDAMEIPGSPFAYLLDATGNVLAKGLVNQVPDMATMIDSVTLPLARVNLSPDPVEVS